MKFPRWELKHTADPLDTRAYDGGGDGGAGQMRADEQERQRKVQAAVDAINAKFGIAPTGGSMETVLGAAPTREQFTKQAGGGYWNETPDNNSDNTIRTWVPQTSTSFDEAGYNKALADYNASKTQIYGAGDPGAAKTARDSMYADISGAVRDTAMRDLDRQYTQASNKNLFGLARSGLMGGSVDAESGGQLQELYGEGRMKAQQAGLQAASDLRGQDERTRQNLISLAQSGLDTGTASSMAQQQMAAAADSAKGAAAGASVGRLFDDLSQAYVSNQVTKARYGQPQQPQQTANYGSLFGTNRYTGTVGR